MRGAAGDSPAAAVRSLDQVAARTGFSDVQVLRLHFKRAVGTSPSRYRKSFSA